MTCNNGRCEFTNAKAAKLDLKEEADGSKTVTMREIKIKDFAKWSMKDDGTFKPSDSSDDSEQNMFDSARIAQIQ